MNPAGSMSAAVDCADERRRARARSSGLGGIDCISVSEDQLTLTVIFFGTVPENLEPGNFRIDGGRRVTGIRVETVDACADRDPDAEACVRLTVDRAGDFSAYRLCVVRADQHGHPGQEPLPELDPRYACAEFTFKQNCPSVLDCAPVASCPPPSYQEPVIDYLAKDYASFRQLLLDRLALTMPAWTERHVPDIGGALAELLAYAGDQLSYQQDAVATEAYLGTARLRASVRRHVRLVDYPMHDGCSARVFVCVETSDQVTLTAGDFRFVTLDAELSAVIPRCWKQICGRPASPRTPTRCSSRCSVRTSFSTLRTTRSASGPGATRNAACPKGPPRPPSPTARLTATTAPAPTRSGPGS